MGKNNNEILILGSNYSTQIKKFLSRFNTGDNCRYASWEHCYNFFNINKDKLVNAANGCKRCEELLDLAALNLGFYLASWGMYRGSSFLLQHDYKIHKRLIKEIFKYNEIETLSETNNSDTWEIINNLIENYGKECQKCGNCKDNQNCGIIIKSYKDCANRYNSKLPSDTLVTKILMGIFGCIPAYDRYFKKGIEIYNLLKNFEIENKCTSNSYNDLWSFYRKNLDKIKETFKYTEGGKLVYNLDYPPMKLVDMYFWQIGYDADMGNVFTTKKDAETKYIFQLWTEYKNGKTKVLQNLYIYEGDYSKLSKFVEMKNWQLNEETYSKEIDNLKIDNLDLQILNKKIHKAKSRLEINDNTAGDEQN